jgi:hypothetical protein
MTTPQDLDSRLRSDLAQSVSDVSADAMTVERLIRNARSDAPARRSHRIWITPLLAAATVAAIVVITSEVNGSSSASRHQTPVPPVHSFPSVVVSPSPTATPPPTTVGSKVIGPFGLGKLRLGMTRAQALATGEVASIETPQNGDTCSLIHLAKKTGSASGADGYWSQQYGIVSIVAPAGFKTPEGIGIGSTIADVEHAYPAITYTLSSRQDAGPRVIAPGNPSAQYWLPAGADNRVTSIMITVYPHQCFD